MIKAVTSAAAARTRTTCVARRLSTITGTTTTAASASAGTSTAGSAIASSAGVRLAQHSASMGIFVAVGCIVNLLVVSASDSSSSDSSSSSSSIHDDSSSSSSPEAGGRTPFATVQSTSRKYGGVYSAIPPVDVASCPSYGCPVLPRDIAFDDGARTALESIRSFHAAADRSGNRATSPSEGDNDSSSSSSAPADAALSTLGSAGGNDHATLTLIGYKGGKIDEQINQDRAFLVSPYMSNANPQDTSTSSANGVAPYPRRLLGVFDGHGRGGEYVSDHTVTKLPELLASKLTDIIDASDSVTNSKEEAVKKILFDTFVEMDKTAPDHVTGGCTATVILQLGNQAYIANAGDSRSFIATHSKSTGETKVVYVTREDKPHLPEERQRVERMGGRVRIPPNAGSSSRVMYKDTLTGHEYGLAMSRSIGDWAAGEVGVIPDPLVDVVSLDEFVGGNDASAAAAGDEQTCTVSADGDQQCLATTAEVVEGDVEVFAVSATDGMLDYIAIDDIAKHVALGLYDDENGPHLLSACEELISAAAGGWQRHRKGRYRDDIAISVSKLSW